MGAESVGYGKTVLTTASCGRARLKPPPKAVAIAESFGWVVVISLARRKDRLTRLQQHLQEVDWPFAWPEIFEAVDGQIVPAPHGWPSGPGAWGCMQSHRRVLELAQLRRVSSLLVLEDDVVFRPDFAERVKAFLAACPPDWDGLMIGGQAMSAPTEVVPGVVRCGGQHGTQRTHCYAVRGLYLRELYRQWVSTSGHCDHVMGPLERHWRVFAPSPFLAGQDAGLSDICGETPGRRYWSPSPPLPVVILAAPRDVAEKLGAVDSRLDDCFRQPEFLHLTLPPWVEVAGQEADALGRELFLWHPLADVEAIRKALPGRIVVRREA